MLDISLVEDLDGFRSLAKDWDDLLGRSRADCVFLGRDWVETWWQVFGADRRLHLLLAHDAGELVGIAPLMIARPPGRVAGARRELMFIGQGDGPTAEYLDFIIVRGQEAPVTEAFCRFLVTASRRRWDHIRLAWVRRDSPCIQQAIRTLLDHGIRLELTRQFECPYLRLPETWDALLGARSANFRSQVRRFGRKLERAGEVRWLRAGADLTTDDALDVLIELNRGRWGEEGESFRDEAYVRFHRQLCRRLQRRGQLWLMLLMVDDRAAAARYDFEHRGKLYNYQGGWLRELSKYKVASVLQAEVIRLAIDAGLVEYDFLGGDEAYKRRWADRARLIAELEGSNTTLRGRTLALARLGKRLLASTRAAGDQK